MGPGNSVASPGEVDAAPRPGLLLEKVHLLYGSQFYTWFAIMTPTSLLGAAVFVVVDQRVKDIFRNIPPLELTHHMADVIEAGLLRFGGFFLTWFLGCFALAAIATVVTGLNREDDETAWRRDAYTRAREHFGALVVTAFITFTAFLTGMFALFFVEMTLMRNVGWSRFSRYNYASSFLIMVIVAGMVSWLGTAIPLILRSDIRPLAALKRSVALSNGYEGALFLLVIESMVGSLLVWYATIHGLSLLFPLHLKYTYWYGWLVNVVGILVSAAVESPLFIGLSLLAQPELFNGSSFPGSEQAADIE